MCACEVDCPSFDPTFDGSLVYKLTQCNFRSFLDNNQLVLVMFYEGCQTKAKFHFTTASVTTKRPNHAYAAVDCNKARILCGDEGATSYPTFQLYSCGQAVGKVHGTQSYKVLRQYVETAGL